MTASPNPAPPPKAWLPVTAAVLTCCLAAYAAVVPLLWRSGAADTRTDVASGVAVVVGVVVLILLWLGRRSAATTGGLLTQTRSLTARQAEQMAAQAERIADQDAQLEQARAREQGLTDSQAGLRSRLEQALAIQQAFAVQAQSVRQVLEHVVAVGLPAAFEGEAVMPIGLTGDLDAELAGLLEQLAIECARAGDREESMRSAVVALSRRVQTAAHRIQEEATLMAERRPGDPDVLEVSMRVDHAAAQQARHAQSMAVLCGEWPGQQWAEPLPLVDVVRAAAGRIIAFRRVEVAGDPDIAAAAPVVEPLIHLTAELLANATQSSPPSTSVPVIVRAVQRGAVIEVNDCGVGLDDHRLTQSRDIASGARPVSLDKLGEFPQTGLAVVGQYARRHGFRVDVAESVYGGVRAVIGVPAELVETVAPAETAAAPAPAIPAAREEEPVRTGTGPSAGLPRRHSPRHEAGEAGETAVPSVPLAGTGTQAMPTGPQPTPEQAGAWMGAFLASDGAQTPGSDRTGSATTGSSTTGSDNSTMREIR